MMDDFMLSARRASTSSVPPASAQRRRNSLPTTGDRFIASRRMSDFDAAHFKLQSPTYPSSPDLSVFSPEGGASGWSKSAYGRRLSCLSEGRNEGGMLTFSRNNSGSSSGGRRGSGDATALLQSMYEDTKFANGKSKRHLPSSPDQVLAMPNMRLDIAGNILDWSKQNMVVVAIEDEVYRWDVKADTCEPLPTCPLQKDISSLAWDPEGCYLAIGDEFGVVEIYDMEKGVLEVFQGSLCSHSAAINSISWSADSNTLYTGQACGCVSKIDLRTNAKTMLTGHTFNSVISTSLSADGRHLACGGDNKTLVWNTCDDSAPLKELMSSKDGLTQAVSWCPWQPSVLATGGDIQGGAVRTWNINTGEQLAEARTESQINSLVWAAETKELISAHDAGHDEIMIWKNCNNELETVGHLKAHNDRVLNLALSPDGTTLASCGADEALMMWKCFSSNQDGSKKKTRKKKLKQTDTMCLTSSLMATMSIR